MADGTTQINAPTSKAITFLINDALKEVIDATNHTFLCNVVCDGNHNLQLEKTSGTLIETSDNDTIFTLGRGKLGYATNSDEFVIAHRDNFTSANCALVQDELGATILNAKSGQLVKIGIMTHQ